MLVHVNMQKFRENAVQNVRNMFFVSVKYSRMNHMSVFVLPFVVTSLEYASVYGCTTVFTCKVASSFNLIASQGAPCSCTLTDILCSGMSGCPTYFKVATALFSRSLCQLVGPTIFFAKVSIFAMFEPGCRVSGLVWRLCYQSL